MDHAPRHYLRLSIALRSLALLGVALGCSSSPAPNADAAANDDEHDASLDTKNDAGGSPMPQMDAGGSDGGMNSGVTGLPSVEVFEADACHDLDVAVSPDFVVTATNSGHLVFYERNGSVDHEFDVGNNNGDQHVVWDDSSKRWFVSFMDSGHMFVIASKDTSGSSWTPWLEFQGPDDIDNPNLTVTTDKVVLVNYECVYVVDKTEVLENASDHGVTPAPHCGLGRNDQIYGVDYGLPVPSTAYFVTMSDDQHLNWISVDGTPAEDNVLVEQHMLAVEGFREMPPFPGVEQQGGTFLRNSGQVADWHADHLWWSKAGRCPEADELTCVRLFDIDTSANTLRDYELEEEGTSLWSAAPGIERNGNMWALMSQVSPSTPPSLVVAGVSANGMVTPPKVVFEGTEPDVTADMGGDWGDFFDCAPDLTDDSVWCLGNYGGPPRSDGCPTPAKLVHITTK
jgi:hypothetical protein